MKLINYLLVTIIIAAITVPTSFAETSIINVGANQIQAIYDYSEFSKTGGASKIYNPSNDKYTFIYKNGTVTGYYGENNNCFIIEQMNIIKIINGEAQTIEHDLINQSIKIHDDTGKLISAYSYYDINDDDGQIGENEKYVATIQYNEDGSYTVKWTEITFDENNTSQLQGEKIEIYDANGKLVEVQSKDQSGNQLTTIKYIYDAAGNLLKTETYNSSGKCISRTYFDSLGRESYTEQLKPGTNEYYVSSKNFYDGAKLQMTVTYDVEGKLLSTIYYDAHGRISYVNDSQGRIIQKYHYNDTSNTQTNFINNNNNNNSIKVIAKPGQILKVESYCYDNNNINSQQVVTWYDQNKAKITYVSGSNTTPNVSNNSNNGGSSGNNNSNNGGHLSGTNVGNPGEWGGGGMGSGIFKHNKLY